MAGMFQIFGMMSEQTRATQSRSDVLRTLIWPIGLLLCGEAILVEARAPAWAVIGDFVMLAAAMFLYLGGFAFCLLTKPDLLRSEAFTIQKLAIEKGLIGDHLSGMVTIIESGQEEDRSPPSIIGGSADK